MIKLYCDKCGEEIKDKYYTINVCEQKISSKRNSLQELADAFSNSNYESKTPYGELSSQTMYCEKCKDGIKTFINNTINNTLEIHPCKGCDTGWGSISSKGCKSCHETCIRLKQYNEKYRT